MSALADRLVLLIACPYCGAGPGRGCVTVNPWRGSTRPPGQRTGYQHADRQRPVQDVMTEAYWWGYRHGVSHHKNQPEKAEARAAELADE